VVVRRVNNEIVSGPHLNVSKMNICRFF